MSTTATTGREIIRVIDGQIQSGEELQMFLADLSGLARSITVHDPQTYAEALEVCKKGNDAIKYVMAAAEPERLRLQTALDELRDQRNKIVGLITSQFSRLDGEARAWNINERQAAQAEQDRLNKGKRIENRVRVEPTLPSVPGQRIVPHYRYEVTDVSKMKREYMKPDDTKIGQKLRADKDIKKSEREIGGIKARLE